MLCLFSALQWLRDLVTSELYLRKLFRRNVLVTFTGKTGKRHTKTSQRKRLDAQMPFLLSSSLFHWRRWGRSWAEKSRKFDCGAQFRLGLPPSPTHALTAHSQMHLPFFTKEVLGSLSSSDVKTLPYWVTGWLFWASASSRLAILLLWTSCQPLPICLNFNMIVTSLRVKDICVDRVKCTPQRLLWCGSLIKIKWRLKWWGWWRWDTLWQNMLLPWWGGCLIWCGVSCNLEILPPKSASSPWQACITNYHSWSAVLLPCKAEISKMCQMNVSNWRSMTIHSQQSKLHLYAKQKSAIQYNTSFDQYVQIYPNPSSNRLFKLQPIHCTWWVKIMLFSLGRNRGMAKLWGHFFYFATFSRLNLQPVQPLMASPPPR